MTLPKVIAIASRVALLVVLAASGAYVLIYLWRWEWERAQIAGIFFLASLLVLGTLLVLRRITAIEQRLASPGSAGNVGPGIESSSAVRPDKPFDWLPDEQSTYIFLPVLLGFGVALSIIAAVAERLVAFAVGTGSQSSRASRSRQGGVIALVLVGVLFASIGIIIVAREQLMTRSESTTPGSRTYLLEVEGRHSEIDIISSVDTLATYCRDRAGVPDLLLDGVRPVDEEHAELVVSPLLGEFGAARFQGCLQDAVLDRRSVSIESVHATR